MPKVLLDTNVWLDYLDLNRTSHQIAEQLITALFDQDFEICIAATSVKDIYYILSRHLGKIAAKKSVGILLNSATLLPVDAEVVQNAFASVEPDLEDGIILACAEISAVSFLVTRDRSGFSSRNALKVTPLEMLKILGIS